VNTVARRIYGGDPWFGGGPYMLNPVARRIYGVDPWIGWWQFIYGERGS
jgi:hypothetical protein